MSLQRNIATGYDFFNGLLAPESVTVGTGTGGVLLAYGLSGARPRRVFDSPFQCCAELSVRGLSWSQPIERWENLCEARGGKLPQLLA